MITIDVSINRKKFLTMLISSVRCHGNQWRPGYAVAKGYCRDLIIVDWLEFPGMNGLELIGKLREIPLPGNSRHNYYRCDAPR